MTDSKIIYSAESHSHTDADGHVVVHTHAHAEGDDADAHAHQHRLKRQGMSQSFLTPSCEEMSVEIIRVEKVRFLLRSH